MNGPDLPPSPPAPAPSPPPWPPGYPLPPPVPPLGPKTDPFAVTALVCGIVSLPFGCCCPFLGGPLAVVGVVFGILSIGRIRKDPQNLGGEGLAIAGIATGGAGLLMGVLSLALGLARSFALADLMRSMPGGR